MKGRKLVKARSEAFIELLNLVHWSKGMREGKKKEKKRREIQQKGISWERGIEMKKAFLIVFEGPSNRKLFSLIIFLKLPNWRSQKIWNYIIQIKSKKKKKRKSWKHDLLIIFFIDEKI